MTRKLLAWMTALALIAGVQCKKHNSLVPDNPYGLPNVGEPGTMGCLINGKPWIASLGALSPNQLSCHAFGDTIFQVAGKDTGYYYDDIVIEVSTSVLGFGLGVPLPFNGSNGPTFFSYITDSSCLGIYTALAPAVSGSITITNLDTVHHELAGTFSAFVPFPPCDTIQITEGRFDYYYTSQ